jgi:hypothetical protein
MMNNEYILFSMTVVPILVFKLAVLWAGVSVVRMGYDLLLRGVIGEFKFQGGFKGVKADLVSASPGLLFALLGVILLAIGTLTDKPFSIDLTSTTHSQTTPRDITAPPPLPINPPGIKE